MSSINTANQKASAARLTYFHKAKVASGCFSTVYTLNELQNRWKLASLSIGSLCAQVSVISASLSQIQGVYSCQQFNSSSNSILMQPELIRAFDIALTGCAVVLSCIDHEVKAIREIEPGKTLDWKAKAQALWNEGTSKHLVDQLQCQSTALNLLIQTVNM